MVLTTLLKIVDVVFQILCVERMHDVGYLCLEGLNLELRVSLSHFKQSFRKGAVCLGSVLTII